MVFTEWSSWLCRTAFFLSFITILNNPSSPLFSCMKLHNFSYPRKNLILFAIKNNPMLCFHWVCFQFLGSELQTSSQIVILWEIFSSLSTMQVTSLQLHLQRKIQLAQNQNKQKYWLTFPFFHDCAKLRKEKNSSYLIWWCPREFLPKKKPKHETKRRNFTYSNSFEKHAALAREWTLIGTYWLLLVCINSCTQKMKF